MCTFLFLLCFYFPFKKDIGKNNSTAESKAAFSITRCFRQASGLVFKITLEMGQTRLGEARQRIRDGHCRERRGKRKEVEKMLNMKLVNNKDLSTKYVCVLEVQYIKSYLLGSLDII